MSQSNKARDSRSSLLHRALLANGIFSSVSGLFLVLFWARIAEFMGLSGGAILIVLGAGLIGFGMTVLRLARRADIPRNWALMVTFLDITWIAGSVLLLVGDVLPITSGGRWAMAVTADIVAVFAILQVIGIRRLNRSSQNFA